MFSLQGGLRAVVWTDLFQGLVMIGGLVAIIVQERKNERIDGSLAYPQTRAPRPLTATPLHRHGQPAAKEAPRSKCLTSWPGRERNLLGAAFGMDASDTSAKREGA